MGAERSTHASRGRGLDWPEKNPGCSGAEEKVLPSLKRERAAEVPALFASRDQPPSPVWLGGNSQVPWLNWVT